MDNLPTLQLYQGDTFSRQVTTPYVPLSNYQISAMGRTQAGLKLCDFTITPIDQTATPGGFLLGIADTSVLPLGEMIVDFAVIDISQTPPTQRHTQKFKLIIQGTMTHA